MAWRYLAYRATTREPLHTDLPLEVEELGWALSASGALRATVSPDVGDLRDAEGRLLLEEWGTLIFAEADGEIRWGGILISSRFTGEAWSLEAASITTYPHGMAYAGAAYSRLEIDPAQIVRDVWGYLQAQPDGDLGVTVTGSTPARLGKPAVPEIPEVYVGGKWVARSSVAAADIDPALAVPLGAAMTATQTTVPLKAIGGYANVTFPITVTIGSEKILVTGRSGATLTGATRGYAKSKAVKHGKGVDVKYPGTPTRVIEAIPSEPYALLWWEAPDLGSEIEALSTETPFDFTESHRWDGDNIVSTVDIAYPRAGRRRTDLAFVQGDNVTEVVTPAIEGDEFANAVIGLGAGEGNKSLHRVTAVRDGRLRRTSVYTAKDVSRADRLDARIRNELARRRDVLEVTEVTVRNHPNAVIGSWALGDDVLIEATLPWLGDVAVWSRVIGWSLLSDDTARLYLARSDSFAYGG